MQHLHHALMQFKIQFASCMCETCYDDFMNVFLLCHREDCVMLSLANSKLFEVVPRGLLST